MGGMGWGQCYHPPWGRGRWGWRGISIPRMTSPLLHHFLDFHPHPHSISIFWGACGSQRRPDSTAPLPSDLASPISPAPSLSFPRQAASCSAAPRPRGGSVGLALVPPGAAETSQLVLWLEGRKLFPSCGTRVSRPRSSHPAPLHPRGQPPSFSLPPYVDKPKTAKLATALSAASTGH